MSAFPLWYLVPFSAGILVLLALDLGVFHGKSHEISKREALGWTITWFSLAIAFAVTLAFWKSGEMAILFITGYLIEQSLSVDNLFIFLLIFGHFSVPKAYQHRVLFWGILGALVLRAIFILSGSALLESFHWIFYVFGAFLLITGIRMVFVKEHELDPEENFLLKLVSRMLPIKTSFHGDKFFVREGGKLFGTPLLLVLVVVESTDVVFAVDSIPAIFAVTTDPFLVYTSNVFAILGLRSLYFLLAGVMDSFRYLKLGLAAVLSFVGIKMLIADWFKIPALLSLAVIATCLAIAAVASWVATHREKRAAA